MAAPASLPSSPRAGELEGVVGETGAVGIVPPVIRVVGEGPSNVGVAGVVVGVVEAEEVDEDSPRALPSSPITKCSMTNSVSNGAVTSLVFTQSQLALVKDDIPRHAHSLCCWVEHKVGLGAIRVADEDAEATPIIQLL